MTRRLVLLYGMTAMLLPLAGLHAAGLPVAVTDKDSQRGAKDAPLQTTRHAADPIQPGEDSHLGLLAMRSPGKPPNIVYILCDDLGYGDVKCLNPQGKIATPNIDRLAGAGMVFTDAHSGSSVCTPTRYGIITGRYCWRTRVQQGVLEGYSQRLIAPGRVTVASLLKQAGYTTACFGKWHLGMDWALTNGDPSGDKIRNAANVDFGNPVKGGPSDCGFDDFYGIAASLDMPPYVYIENDKAVSIPTEITNEGGRPGLTATGFKAVEVLPTLTRKTVGYIDRQCAGAKNDKPFFIYLPLNSPHTPIVPSAEWRGKSTLGRYGDFVMETDWAVGEVMAALERNGIADHTLVIFTSDNGCSPAAGIPELESKGHSPNHIFRGHKADIWDGGHRIPFICRWPGKIKAGSNSSQLTCLTDLMATCAEIAGLKVPDDAGEDSVSMLPALLGRDAGPLREAVVHHSIEGKFAIRQGNWKLELCPGSGGWSKPKEADASKQGLPKVQLYDMSGDVGESVNVQDQHPDLVERLTRLLEKYVAEGRSTPGAAQKNDVMVDIWKGNQDAKITPATEGKKL
ncbi:MAG: arylsulfatase [Verrucomicrobia bacterium]|nr:arylsulfatase [Verrucomicrobiota bacterium]